MDSNSTSNKLQEDTNSVTKIYDSKFLLGILIGFSFYGIIGLIWHFINGYAASIAFVLIPVFSGFIISLKHKEQ